MRHLVNQEPIILFMATIGLAYFLEGLGDLMWGADVKAVDVGLPQGGSLWFEDLTKGWAPADAGYWGMYIDKLDVVAALVAAALVAGADALLAVHPDRPGAARGGRRPPGGAVGRDLAARDLGHRLVDRRARRAGRRRHVGRAKPGCSSRCR